MPYRIDLPRSSDDTIDILIALGALDVEQTDNGLAALMPDSTASESLVSALGVDRMQVSPAVGRDEGSVWVLSQRPVLIGGLLIAPAEFDAPPDALKLIDSPVFGTGLHPTTALCLEMIDETVEALHPSRVLDVGTGSGVLALAALRKGVPEAVGLDIDADALAVARENARINSLTDRITLTLGGLESVEGAWPFVLANVLAAPLIDMAPILVQRVAHGGRLVLSGIASAVAPDVERTYRRLGMRPVRTDIRAGWAALMLDPSW